jgi:hypothetical protein
MLSHMSTSKGREKKIKGEEPPREGKIKERVGSQRSEAVLCSTSEVR